MSPLRCAILATLLLPVLGHAAYSTDHVNITCSSSLTQTGGDTLGYLCAGNLTLQGDGQMGTLTSDTAITLAAGGNLTLERLSLIAPRIDMQSGYGGISVSADTRFFFAPGEGSTPPAVTLLAGNPSTISRPPLSPIDTSAGAIVIQPGPFTVNVQATVPEPSSTLLLMFGLSSVAWLRRKR